MDLTKVKPKLRLRLRLRLRQILFSHESVPVIMFCLPTVGTLIQPRVHLKLYVWSHLLFDMGSGSNIWQLRNHFCFFFTKKVPTIGIEQAIVCNSKLGTEKISPTDLHITWQKCPKIWWKQTAIQLVV